MRERDYCLLIGLYFYGVVLVLVGVLGFLGFFLGRGRVDRICQYLLEILTNRLNLPGGYSVS